MDKPQAAELLRLEILRRERLARLSSLPEGHRRVIVALRLAVEALEEDTVRAARVFTVPAHHEAGPRDIVLTGIRLLFPGSRGPRSLSLRADAHYADCNECCALPR